MYVDEKLHGEVTSPRAEPSLDGFISFLETKRRFARYRWQHAGRCACGQYAQSIGQGEDWGIRRWGGDRMWTLLDDLALDACGPRARSASFGTLLDLARAKRAELARAA